MQRIPLLLTLATLACAPQPDSVDARAPRAERSANVAIKARPDKMPRPTADVVSVTTREVEGGYEFAVGIASPDTGCERYADWWEVVSEEGELIYRRPLSHSHVDEQPFVRSGGPVPIETETEVWVRAHLHPIGYGGQAYKGSVAVGFDAAEPMHDFAPDLAGAPPAPPPCRF